MYTFYGSYVSSKEIVVFKILKFWYNYLLLNEIDLVVSGTTPHVVFDFVLYSVCRYLKIPFRFFHRLPVVVGASTYLYCADSIDPLILNPAGYSSLEKVNHSHINAYLRLGQPRGSSTLTFDGVKNLIIISTFVFFECLGL